ncbi:hypothetical protein NQS36_16350 [Bacillus sp. C1(2022)]|jgi:hypothetical protein|uniref:Uncharacterized protein n=1 Tax=Bacillus licheniformis TaxID=1402 RepID=A0A8B5Y6L1_BACLI|nr:hypothetical protein [Bacillus licheniformis]MDE1375006.1 hypothetical protein [Bacillus licheniformis]MDZ5538899.1 hypothetical protein [Bacillus licheniformis]TWL22017.1 hypothetical protein CHCC16736_0480 [Bacillus licheniformis]
MKKEHVKTVYSNSSQEAFKHANSAQQLGFGANIEQTRPERLFDEFGQPDEDKAFRVHIFKFIEEAAE